MKKNVLKFGLIAGALISAFVVFTMNIWGCESNAASMYLGFTAQILALSFMFVAIKNYRDNENGGVISFGKAFTIGLYIAFIASTMYVAIWLIDYYCFIPDFWDKALAHAQSSGLPAAELKAKTAQFAEIKGIYKSPVLVVVYTYLEIFPTGLIVSLVAALIMKKKQDPDLAPAV
jgi:hypothetical protein